MKIRITLTEQVLGTACNDPDVHAKFIASRSKDAAKEAEEAANLSAEEAIERAMTVFPRNKEGQPILYDYQIKGFLKEALGILIELEPTEVAVGKTKVTKWTFKRIVDNYVFVFPRQIPLPCAEVGQCTRPLRADTMRGERVSLVTSETVPAGTAFELEIKTLTGKLDGLIRQCLDYGALKGIGQWRNASNGRFTWEEVK